MPALTKTFDQRIELNDNSYQYFMSGLMVVFSLIVWLGKLSIFATEFVGAVKVVLVLLDIVIISMAYGLRKY